MKRSRDPLSRPCSDRAANSEATPGRHDPSAYREHGYGTHKPRGQGGAQLPLCDQPRIAAIPDTPRPKRLLSRALSALAARGPFASHSATDVVSSNGSGRRLAAFPLVSSYVEPPPESNRRPHPYHGTTRNRCAERRFPSSRPTVEAEVIGSLSAKLCVLHPGDFPQMCRPQCGRRRSISTSCSFLSPGRRGDGELLMVRLHHLPGAPRRISGHRGAGFVTAAPVGRS
jgi:hypothetical protein